MSSDSAAGCLSFKVLELFHELRINGRVALSFYNDLSSSQRLMFMRDLHDKDNADLSRRNFLRSSAAGIGAAAFIPSAFASTGERKDISSNEYDQVLKKTGQDDQLVIIKGGYILSMDPDVGDFESGDILIRGKKIVKIAHSIDADGAEVIDARGRIVMPGFIDTHHHQFETALRSFLPNGLLYDDGSKIGKPNYMDDVLGKLAPVYRPEDVYISELLGGLSQLDAGVTTVLDISQVHHSPEHSDAVYQALNDTGRRAALGYFEGHGLKKEYPQDARRMKNQYFSSDDQLITMVMGGETYLKDVNPLTLWNLGKELNIPVALHANNMGAIGKPTALDGLLDHFTSSHLFIHMTGVTPAVWRRVRETGGHISLSVPIEMSMRHGVPPIIQALNMGIEPSLSSDVETTMSADFFTQMRSALTLQRSLVNQDILEGKIDVPDLLTSRDVLRFATINGAKALNLDHRTGSLTPGKEADIILLDAEALNVVPVNNVPGAVVTLMDRSNVETVLVAGKIRKWKGELVGKDINSIKSRLLQSRDYLFETANVKVKLFD